MFISKYERISTIIWPGMFLASVRISEGDGHGVSMTTVANTIREDKDSLDGIAIYSDSDPLLIPDLYRFIRDIRQPRLDVVIVTRGVDPANLEDLVGAGYVTHVIFMVDGPADKHLAECAEVARAGKCMFNTVVEMVPGRVDENVVVDAAKATRGANHMILHILDPEKDPRMKGQKQFKKTDVKSMAKAARALAKDVKIMDLN